jgi:uncharacterized protein (TIGR03118 family)
MAVWFLYACSLLITGSNASAQYIQSNLVADNSSFGAAHVDSKLIDPWGLAILPGGVFAIANAHSGTITFYGESGVKLPMEVTVPPAPGSPAGTLGSPTGIVINNSASFIVQEGGRSAPAWLIVDTLDGLICGWNPMVDATHALIMVDNSAEAPFPASYTALVLAPNSHGQPILYAADSGAGPTTSNNEIVMYDSTLKPAGHFGDSEAPSMMTVFGLQNVGDEFYVTYAAFTPMQGGVVDVFNSEGKLQRRFAANGPAGPLEEPWAITRVPDDFGRFSGAILVGNFTNGRINAYSPSGVFLGQLDLGNGTPLTSGLGLWALTFVQAKSQRGPTLFFTTGVNGETDGIFGTISPAGRDH